MSEEIKPVEPKVIEYCPHCTFPAEYCEFSNTWPKCSLFLKEKYPELFTKFKAAKDAKAALAKAKAAEALAAKDPEAAAKLAAEEAEKEAEKEAKKKARMEKKAQNPDEDDEDEDDEDDELQFVDITPAPVEITAKQEIRLQVTERTKRKRVTTVDGVDSFGINEKELGKLIAKKFATSCGSGETGLIVNGDLIYDIAEFIIEKYPQVPEKAFIKIEKGGIRKKLF